MFQRRTSDGVFRSGLVAASVMLFLRDPILAPISDFISYRLDMDLGNMFTYMGIFAIYYFIAGFILTSKVKNPSGVAVSASFWTLGLALFWLLYTHTLGPAIEGMVAPDFPMLEIWAQDLGVEAMAFFAVVGAYVGKLK